MKTLSNGIHTNYCINNFYLSQHVLPKEYRTFVKKVLAIFRIKNNLYEVDTLANRICVTIVIFVE